MKKAVIFDLDGTLADSLYSIAYSMNQVLMAHRLPVVEEREFRYFVGDGAAELVKRVLHRVGDQNLILYREVFAEYVEVFEKYCMLNVKPYKGITETLHVLKEQGIKLAVLSNKPHKRTEEVIQELFGEGLFDVVLGQSEDRERKPSPAGVFAIAERLNLQMDEIVYVGDTNTDMQTGKRAGAFTIGVLWGFRDREELEEHHADGIIEKPQELLEIVGKRKEDPTP